MKFIFLSGQFYTAYAHCPEIERKTNRPYAMVPVKIGQWTFAVPLRSHIHHKYVLWTDEANHCGLDFSKAVVIEKPEYISDRQPHIRPNEFERLRGKEYEVERRMRQYIKTYKKARSRQDVPRNRTLCQYSTLQYFEEYL